jgi:hypothetical protein
MPARGPGCARSIERDHRRVAARIIRWNMSIVIEQRIATLLGNFSLLPLFALAAACWFPWAGPGQGRAQFALAAYTALVLAFLGGVHWGLVLKTPQLNKAQSWNALGWSAVALVLGWLAVSLLVFGLPPALVFAFLIADLLLAWAMDNTLFRQYQDIPQWYPALRMRLTLAAVVALAIALLGSL